MACCFRNEGWGAKNHLIYLLFTGGVQGEPGRLKHQWVVWKQFISLKKQCFLIHCSKSKRLSWFCFIFRSSNRIMGLLRKNWVISWLFPQIKMPWWEVMINRWEGQRGIWLSSIGQWALQGTQLEAVLNTGVFFCFDVIALITINSNQDFS